MSLMVVTGVIAEINIQPIKSNSGLYHERGGDYESMVLKKATWRIAIYLDNTTWTSDNPALSSYEQLERHYLSTKTTPINTRVTLGPRYIVCDGRKVLGTTINEETPIATLLKPAIELGETTDVGTIYHPKYYSKTVEIYYFPYAYWTPTLEPTVQAPSVALTAPILSTSIPAALPAAPITPMMSAPNTSCTTSYTDNPINRT
ncbi:hypothetical protein TKK_0017109 [Trichogramma kaykai]